MTGHARLSPSNHRWVHCPGSIQVEANYPDDTNEYAIDGTGTHLLIEECLNNNVRVEQYLDQVIGKGHHDKKKGWMVKQDRIDRAKICLDYITLRVKQLNEQFPEAEVNVYSETRSNPGLMCNRDDWYGTVDVIIVVHDEHETLFLEVIDYKDGRGWVHVKDNSQLQSYLIGMWALHPAKAARMTIVQPKTSRAIRYEDVNNCFSYVFNTLHTLKTAAEATDTENALLMPGDHCTWCKHGKAGNCQPLKDYKVGQVQDKVSQSVEQLSHTDLSYLLRDVSGLSDDELAKIADAEAGVIAAFERVKDELQKRIEGGQSINGYEMRPGRSSKEWVGTNEETARLLRKIGFNENVIFQAKLCSPAQALKAANKKQKEEIKDLFVVLEGKQKLTQVSYKDKPSIDEMFKDVK